MNSLMKSASIGPPAGPTALLALTIQFAVAQVPDPSLSGIAHVAIRVSSLDQARAFFHKLGFDEAFAMDQGGSPTEAFFKVNDRQFIELYPRRDPAAAVGFIHVCFEAADINSLKLRP
ncbi:MAG: VOC family protein [Acidobacteriaceae bacterium]